MFSPEKVSPFPEGFLRKEGPLRTAIISVDEVPRDFLGHLLLATALATAGFRVVLAHAGKEATLMRFFSEAVVIGKGGFQKHSPDIMRKFQWVVLPTEGAFFREPIWKEIALKKNYAPFLKDLPPNGMVFVWGEEQRALLAGSGYIPSSRVFVTGTPRFDLALPENHWLTADITRGLAYQLGDFVLVNTSFSIPNGEQPLATRLRQETRGLDFIGRAKSVRVARQLVELQSKGFWPFISFVEGLATHFHDTTFVVRPHPAESIAMYQTLFADYKNVKVLREGNVLPWILASKCSIGSNCTTLVEAAFAGVPTLEFSSEDGRDGVAIASEAGHRVGTVQEGIVRLQAVLNGRHETKPLAWSPSAVGRLANCSGPSTPKVLERILRSSEGQTDSKFRGFLPRKVRRIDSNVNTQKKIPLPAELTLSVLRELRDRTGVELVVSLSAPAVLVIEPA